MSLYCPCPDWEPEIKKINDPICHRTIRSGGAYKYDGKPFVFCPWCSTRLRDTEGPKPGTCEKCGRPTFGPICGECKGDYPKRV